MAIKKGSQDDKLIRDLYEKLDWFTFKATDEEFDPEQVQAILNLLDKLDPLPNEGSDRADRPGAGAENVDAALAAEAAHVPASSAAEAFQRFKSKYHITDEDLARKNAGSAADETADGGKPVSFPAEFSEELAFDSAQVREFQEGKNAPEKTGGHAGSAAEGDAETDRTEAAGEHVPANAAQKAGSNENMAAVPTAAKSSGEESAPAGTKKRKRFLASAWGKIAVALLAVVVVGAGYSIGTSAVQQKPFLDVVRDGINGFKVTVTGNEMESEAVASIDSYDYDKVYYDSWEEIAAENDEILIPGYIPEGLELQELYEQDYKDYILYQGAYQTQDIEYELIIQIKCYGKEYAKVDWENTESGMLVKEDEIREISYYQMKNCYAAIWSEDRCLYLVKWINLDDIEAVVEQLN